MRNLVLRMLVVAISAAPFSALGFDWSKLKVDSLKDASEKLKQLRPLSEEQEVELGKGVAANLVGAAPLVNDPALQEYVNKVGRWLALHTDRPGLDWHFGVLDTSGINAFATPGGYVFITRGMLLQMRDESELAGVLAHEISHVTAKHALETMRKGRLASMAGDALSSYAEKKGKESYTKLVGAGTEIFTRGLDKEDEFAADRMGVVIAARAGYDPYGLAAVLQTLASINPQDGAVALMFKTHPAPGQRLELLLAAMEGKLDTYADSPKLAERFSKAVSAQITAPTRAN